MSIVRIDNPNELRPAHVALLCVVLIALAGNCLLTSAAKPAVLPDGAVEWDPDSPLLAIVELLDLEYAQPTPKGVAIKKFVSGLATGVGILIVAIGMIARRDDAADELGDTVIDLERVATGASAGESVASRQLDPVRTSQALLVAYLAWSFLSATWSHAPEFAIGGAVLLAVEAGWAFVLGFGLNRRAAAISSYMMLAVLVATAVLANAYAGERNPTLRASYPIGNPLFLAACLVPGLLLACSGACSSVVEAVTSRGRIGLPLMFVLLAAAAVMIRTFYAAGSRGPAIGLAVGVLAIAFFAGRRKMKWVVGGAVVVGLAVAGGYFVSRSHDPSATGRSASMRARFYAWDYALDLFQAHPIVGNGQGGYTLLADRYAADDVEADPEALDARIAHAHSEWLEVASDLGSVGVVLVGGSLLLALYGGVLALRRAMPARRRVALVAMLGSLVALIVDQCTSPGLRHAGLPLVFYTVLGLVWALSTERQARLFVSTGSSRWLARGAVLAAACCALAISEAARSDFAAARALYDSDVQLDEGEWDEATWSASRARSWMLDSHDRLIALHRLVECHQLASAALQAKYISRRQAAESAEQIDPILVDRAQQARAESEAHLVAGYQQFETLQAAAYGSIATASLEHGLRLVHALYAEIDGDMQTAAELRRQAADAIERQIARQPYNAQLAGQYVVEASDRLSMEQILDLLARPLRVSTMPGGYVELLASLSSSEAFIENAATIFESARTATGEEALQTWAPEKLRLAAAIAFVSHRYADAAEDLKRAAGIYDQMQHVVPLAQASCHAELADALFLTNPDAPQEAVQQAESALKYAPRSEFGRALCDAIGARLICYHLAAGHEDFARTILSRTQPSLSQKELDTLTGESYVRTAFSVLDQMADKNPTLLAQWAKRSQELAPDSPLVWAFAAELAIRAADESAILSAMSEFKRTGGSAEAAADLLQRATAALPESEALAAMLREVQDILQQSTQDAQKQGGRP